MMDTTNISGPDRTVAVDYVFQAGSLIEVCEKNAEVARRFQRQDHERMFEMLHVMIAQVSKSEGQTEDNAAKSIYSPLMMKVLEKMWVTAMYTSYRYIPDWYYLDTVT